MKIILFDSGNVFVDVICRFGSFMNRLILFYMADKRPHWFFRGVINYHKREHPSLSEREIYTILRKGLGENRTFWERFSESERERKAKIEESGECK